MANSHKVNILLKAVDKASGVIDKVANKSSDAADKIGSGFNKAGAKIQGAGEKLSTTLTPALLAVGAAAGGAVNKGMKFNKQMDRVASLSGATGNKLDKLRSTAKKMGKTTSYSATQAAKGLQYMAQAGWKTEKMTAALPSVLKLAKAQNMQLGRVSDITSDIMSGFSIEAEKAGHVTNVLAKTASTANTDVNQLGEAMSYTAPIANQAKMSIEETSAALGLLANNGIKGSKAGTALNAVISDMKNMSDKAAAAWDKQGVKIYNANEEMKSMSTIVKQVSSATADMTQKQKDQFLQMTFGRQGMRAFNTLLKEGGGDLNEYSNQLENSSGALDKMWQTMRDNLGGDLSKLQSRINAIAIKFSEGLIPVLRNEFIPMANKTLDKVKQLVGWFNKLSPAAKKVIIMVGAIGGVLGPVLTVIGGFISIIGSAITYLGMLGPYIVTAAKFIGGLVGAFNPLIIIVGAVIAAFVLFREEIMTILGAVFDFIGDMVKKGIEAFKDLSTFIAKKVINAFVAIGEEFDNVLSNLVKSFKSLGPVIKQVFIELGKMFKNIFKKLIDIARKAWNGLKGLLSGIINSIKSTFKNIINRIQGFFRSIIDFITSIHEKMYNAGADLINGLIEGIKSKIDAAIELVKNGAKNIIDKVKGIFDTSSPSKVMMKIGENVSQGLADGIKQGQPQAAAAGTDLASSSVGAVQSNINERGSGNNSGQTVKIEQHNTFKSKQALDEKETRRQNERLMKKLGLEFGLR